MSETAVAVGAAVATFVLTGALAGLWRRAALGRLLRDLRLVVEDMRGQPAVLGREAVPPLGEQLRQVRSQGADTADTLHQLVDDVAGLSDRVAVTDQRITDHRRRNAAQVELLRAELHQRLDQLGEDHLRAEAYRAALAELGIDTDPPTPPERTYRP